MTNWDEQLLEAAQEGNLLKLNEALDNGAKVDAKDPNYLSTALMKASWKGHKDIIEALRAADADLYATDR